MYLAFCPRFGCEWESTTPRESSLAALRDVDRHLAASHTRPGVIVGIATDEVDQLLADAAADLGVGIRNLDPAYA